MMETEIRTDEFDRRRLYVRFPDTGPEDPVLTCSLVSQVGMLRRDVNRNVMSFNVWLGDDDYWPVEQFLADLENWNMHISDEDVAALREQFPFPWRPTWNSVADHPLPRGITCDDDCGHEATVCFRSWPTDIHDSLSYDKMLCKHCSLTRQIKYLKDEISKLTDQLGKTNSALTTAVCRMP